MAPDEPPAAILAHARGLDPSSVRRWAQRWREREDGELAIGPDEASLTLSLHPGCEPIELAHEPEEDRRRIRVGTLSGGPGYHARASEALEDLAAAAQTFELEDPTGWWQARDRSRLEQAARRWWCTAGRRALQNAERTRRPILFGLPPDSAAPEIRGARVVTPLRVYRLPAWRTALEQIAQDTDPAEHVPWWNVGKDAAYWRNLARAWLARRSPAGLGAQRRRWERITAAAERARALDPTIELPDAALAEAYEALEQPERVVAHLEAALAREPGRTALRRWLIETLRAEGRHTQAAEQLERLATHRPHDPDAAYRAALAWIDTGAPERALPLLERAIELAPRRAAYHGELAVALAALGRLEDALAANERALALAPEHPVAREHRQRLLTALGRAPHDTDEPSSEGRPPPPSMGDSSASR